MKKNPVLRWSFSPFAWILQTMALKRSDSKRASKPNNISLKIVKEYSDIGGFLAKSFSECLEKGFFPDELKWQKLWCIKDNNNYRPDGSILSNISKLYERCYDKLSSKELLERDKFITIQKNLPHLTIEIYKVKMGISPVIMKDLSIQ